MQDSDWKGYIITEQKLLLLGKKMVKFSLFTS
jgi:hypothetical protein